MPTTRLEFISRLSSLRPVGVTFALLTGCFFALFVLFLILTDVYYFYPKGAVINSLGAALFFSLPVLFLPRRLRTAVPVTVMALVSVFLFCQYLYYLIFGDFFSGSALYASDLTDTTFVSSALSLVSLKSLSIFAPLLVTAVVLTLRRGRPDTATGLWLKIASLILFMTIPFGLYAVSMRRLYMWTNVDGSMTWLEAYRQQQVILNYPDTPRQLTLYLGPGFLLYYFLTSLDANEITLTPEERARLAESIPQRPACCVADSAAVNKRSLILIFVESFNSSVLDIPQARTVLPTITSLMDDSGTVTATKVLTQVSHGESSDGQFIVTTGLLPFRNGALVSHFSRADYPSLPKALGCSLSAEVICESADIWQHSSTTLSYGYGALYDRSVDEESPDRDSRVLERATSVLDSLTHYSHYMLMVSTIDMHMPYFSPKNLTRPLDVTGPEWSGYDNRCLNYITATHEFDRALGVFLDSVAAKSRAAGMPLPVVAIVGDHAAPRNSLTPPLDTKYVPLIVCNTDRTLRYETPIGQIDIFPTLLDIMGVDSYTLPSTGRPYRGLGESILSATPPVGAVDTEGCAVEGTVNPEAKAGMWQLSDSLIRSRFFQ